MSDIVISERTEGMVDASAAYYQESRIFKAIQNAQALEYDRIEDKTADLALQLSPLTATWGLKFWEEGVGLPVQDNDDYEARRPAVVARWYGKDENFSAEMLRTIVAAYGKTCTIHVDVATSTVTIIFLDGIPSQLASLQKAVEDVIHAHLGSAYRVLMTPNPMTLYHAAVTSIRRHLYTEKQEYNTYNDVKDLTYEAVRDMTYEDILRKG